MRLRYELPERVPGALQRQCLALTTFPRSTVSYCVKIADGPIVEEGKLRATHEALRQWAEKRQEPWRGALEATLFSGWIYDTLNPFAAELQMGTRR